MTTRVPDDDAATRVEVPRSLAKPDSEPPERGEPDTQLDRGVDVLAAQESDTRISPAIETSPDAEPSGAATTVESSGAAASLAGSGTSLSSTSVRDTLHLRDVGRTRYFLRVSFAMALIVAAPLPWMGGNGTVKAVLAVSMLATAVATLLLDRQLRDPQVYYMKRLLLCGYTCVAGAFCGVLYYGVFSPAPVVIPYGLYFFSLSQGFRRAFGVFVVCAVGYFGLALLITFGALPDPGVLQPADVTQADRLGATAVTEALIVGTYLIARLSRRATDEALAQHDRAVRALAGREALLHEARLDLDRVLRARGLGRFAEQEIGEYRLGALIGRGGMGEVYDAVHRDTERPAAVKLLHPHLLEDPQGLQRFLRECRATRALDVPYVVQVLATSEPDAPLPHIVMERLYGQDLAALLRDRGRLKLSEVLTLVREVGRGLDAASRARIVHRDIKPRNVFRAERPGGRPVWKILDFGVSKLAGEVTVTQHGVVGTPSYMAPEQATGGRVSHRTDLFALGVIAYRAVTGRPAFAGDSTPAILYDVVHSMPPQPSALRRLPEQVDLVLAVALAKKPDDRFDSGREFAEALAEAARGRITAPLRERAERVLQQQPWSG